jgi:hypothetical protein
MHVECYKFFHSAAPFFFVGTHHYRMADGVALSYFHSGENRDPVLEMVPDFRRDDVWTPAFAGVTLQKTFCEITKIHKN